MKGTFVKELVVGPVTGVFKVKEVALKTGKNGKNYIDAVLFDKTGSIPCKVWDITPEAAVKWTNGAVFEIKGRLEKWKDRPQIVVESATPAEGLLLDASAFEDASPVSLEELKSEFNKLTDKIGDAGLSALIKAVFSDKAVWERFSIWPAAVQYHHAYKHGLLEHTVSVGRLGLEIANATGRVDKDYLLTGCCLHDIGKIYELTGTTPYDYTDEGRLIGHIFLGTELVRQKADGVKGFAEDKLIRVLHMILAHHGEREFGSPVLPATAEAIALHHIDNIDAKLQAADYVTARDQTPGSWTDYVKMFETKLFKGAENTGE